MSVFGYGIAGIIGGLVGGMGMGGGTLLIPILTIFYGVGQHNAQAINLIAFVPMSIVALRIHIKNGYIEKKNAILIIVSGMIMCGASCFLANAIDDFLLKKLFGCLLLVLSVYQFVKNINMNKR